MPGDGYALFKFTPPQILQAVEEGARLYLAGTKVRGLALSKGTENPPSRYGDFFMH